VVSVDDSRIFDLKKRVVFSLKKQQFDPAQYPAAVLIAVDASGSTEGTYRLYSSGTMQRAVETGLAAGLVFDDDGIVPTAAFGYGAREIGDMTIANYEGFLQFKRLGYDPETQYLAAMDWAIAKAESDGVMKYVKRGDSAHGQGRRNWWPFGSPNSLRPSDGPRATAPYPVYVCIFTDGEPSDSQQAIRNKFVEASYLPIFWQFIGVGGHDFTFLRELDEELPERFVDNANFFDAKDVAHDPERMVEKMMGEFPDYYRKAIDLGLIVRPVA
jgi:hypothetical protein